MDLVVGYRNQIGADGDNNGVTDNNNTYAYDNLDRTTSISQSGGGALSKKAASTYDNAGHETSLVRYNTAGTAFLTTTYGFDAAGRLSLMQNLLPAGTTGYSYGYDADSRTTQMQQTSQSPNYTYTANYGYDNEGQLSGTTYANGISFTSGFAYDPKGNETGTQLVYFKIN